MALWGITDADEAKPKWLTTAQKKEVFANNSGWVVEAGSTQTGNDNTDAQPEVLCCVGDLATGIGAADITEIEFITTAFDKSDGGNIDVRVRFNEQVTVNTSGGTPTLTITNDTPSRNLTATYLSGSTTNELIFRKTIAAANAAQMQVMCSQLLLMQWLWLLVLLRTLQMVLLMPQLLTLVL
mgnify:CR=1 FL=1